MLTETTVTLERTGNRILTKLLTHQVTPGTSSPALGAQKLYLAVITSLQDLKADNIETRQTHFNSRPSVGVAVLGCFRPDSLDGHPGGSWQVGGGPGPCYSPHARQLWGLKAHFWEENHFPSTHSLAAGGDGGLWPRGFPSPVRLLTPTQCISAPERQGGKPNSPTRCSQLGLLTNHQVTHLSDLSLVFCL